MRDLNKELTHFGTLIRKIECDLDFLEHFNPNDPFLSQPIPEYNTKNVQALEDYQTQLKQVADENQSWEQKFLF